MNKKQLILASKSPRRKELLSLCNIPFKTIASNTNEYIDESKPLKEEIVRLAYEKAYSVYVENKDCIVLGSDTIVVINNKVLGKPKDEEDAVKMLRLLSNNVHEVITATVFISSEEIIKNCNVSKVSFNKLSEKDINEYVKSKEPLDKAGSYGIQGIGGCFINNIDGDYYSIMGLTLNFVYSTLNSLKEKYDFI
ncbi:MAG: septum formation inhibitor Maf [Erysipelotrichaceae bacterium]|nr:septum formation inhibitor Maf [Erysipelotrichaceae bacterium]